VLAGVDRSFVFDKGVAVSLLPLLSVCFVFYFGGRRFGFLCQKGGRPAGFFFPLEISIVECVVFRALCSLPVNADLTDVLSAYRSNLFLSVRSAPFFSFVFSLVFPSLWPGAILRP